MRVAFSQATSKPSLDPLWAVAPSSALACGRLSAIANYRPQAKGKEKGKKIKRQEENCKICPH